MVPVTLLSTTFTFWYGEECMGLSMGNHICTGEWCCRQCAGAGHWGIDKWAAGQEWGSWNSFTRDWRMGKWWSTAWHYAMLAKLSGVLRNREAENDFGQVSASARSGVHVWGLDNRGFGRWRDKKWLFCYVAKLKISWEKNMPKSN